MYRPPRPQPLPALAALIRVVWSGDGNLLSLLPDYAYRRPAAFLGYSRRSILLVNEPDAVRRVLTDPDGIFPKNDLMRGAVEPLVGDSIFTSSGPTWRRQRQMIDPAFSHMRINRAFVSMTAAVDAYQAHLEGLADRGEPFSLDLAMGHLTADVICRTVFSTPLAEKTAYDVYESFAVFERSAAHVQLKSLIFDPPFKEIPQHPHVLEACASIREHLGRLVEPHLQDAEGRFDDIASACVAARDPNTGDGFTKDELVDQLGVFFLAGHETTASALTWAFFIVAILPEVRDRIRAEVAATVGDGPIAFEDIRGLPYTRNVFRETLRLYPPLTFIPRVALEPTELVGIRVKRGAMIMVAPWVIHRHDSYWTDPHVFDPDRFAAEREKDVVPGTYLPFGLGPRVCVGASFATVESTLILARLVRAFDFEPEAPERVRPVARLTTRPAQRITCRVRRRAA